MGIRWMWYRNIFRRMVLRACSGR